MNILHLISSPRGEASASIKLGNAIIRQLQNRYPQSKVTTRDLTKDTLPHLTDTHLSSFFTPPAGRTPLLQQAALSSDAAIAQLMDAHIIVIGLPMYNFNIHSGLKSWVDHIVRAGLTFNYTESGAAGLLHDKKVYLAVASGGIYSEGPMMAMDFTVPYLNNILSFIGISDITVYRAEGLAIPGIKEHAIEKAISAIAI